jgi:hypothetical protein
MDIYILADHENVEPVPTISIFKNRIPLNPSVLVKIKHYKGYLVILLAF